MAIITVTKELLLSQIFQNQILELLRSYFESVEEVEKEEYLNGRVLPILPNTIEYRVKGRKDSLGRIMKRGLPPIEDTFIQVTFKRLNPNKLIIQSWELWG